MMSREIHVRELAAPFKVSFRHAAADRAMGQSVWVVIDDDGSTGLGEGCPRSYVTGESAASAIQFLDSVRDETDEINDVNELRQWVSDHRTRIDAAPAAWCALELAMLDCFARKEGVAVEALLGLPALAPVFRYTAVLGDSGDAIFAGQLEQYQSLCFHDFKLKVSGDAYRDRERVHAICAIPGSVLRLDANNLWSDVEALDEWREIVQPQVFAIEEPLRTGDIDDLHHLGGKLGIPIILDENFLRLSQLAKLAADPNRWILNIRVSKMGGVLRSLEIVDVARDAGLRVIVGAQVGETSVLTRAALPVAQAADDLLVGHEGAFGEFLLERDLVEPVLQFGQAGRLDTGTVAGKPGLGLRLRPGESRIKA